MLQQRGQYIRIAERKKYREKLSFFESNSTKVSAVHLLLVTCLGPEGSQIGLCVNTHCTIARQKPLTFDHHRASSPPSRYSRIPECKKTPGKRCVPYIIPCILLAHLLFHYFSQSSSELLSHTGRTELKINIKKRKRRMTGESIKKKMKIENVCQKINTAE